MVIGMLFPTINNANIQFADKVFTWRTYTIKKALPTTRCIELIDKKKFAKTAFDENVKAVVVHMSFLNSKMTIYPVLITQIALL